MYLYRIFEDTKLNCADFANDIIHYMCKSIANIVRLSSFMQDTNIHTNNLLVHTQTHTNTP